MPARERRHAVPLRALHRPGSGCRFTPDAAHTVRLQTNVTDPFWSVTLGGLTGTEADGTPHDEPPQREAVSGDGIPDSARRPLPP